MTEKVSACSILSCTKMLSRFRLSINKSEQSEQIQIDGGFMIYRIAIGSKTFLEKGTRKISKVLSRVF